MGPCRVILIGSRPLYASVASLTVDTDADTSGKAVERIRAHLESAGCQDPATG